MTLKVWTMDREVCVHDLQAHTKEIYTIKVNTDIFLSTDKPSFISVEPNWPRYKQSKHEPRPRLRQL